MGSVLRRGWAPLLAAGVLVLALSSSFWAGGGDAKSVDRAIHASLKEVINQGAFLFNKFGDHYGCYRTYDGALRSIRPLLSHHGDLQKAIDEGLEAAEQMAKPSDRAFALRKVLDTVRAKLVPADQVPGKDKVIVIKDKVIIKDKVAKPATLWDRLGGEANVRRVVHDFVVAAGADPKVNITRDGKLKLDDKKVALLEQRVVEYISSVSGGPLKYTGKPMKEAHKGMAITDAEFDATGVHFVAALQKHGARRADIDALVKIILTTRKDIVEKAAKKKVDEKPLPPLPPGSGRVTGKVTFSNGVAAPSGYLTLINEEGAKFSTYIQPNGAYAFKTPLAQGNYIVTIEPALKGDPLADKNVPIPAYYRDARTSPIRADVRPGQNVLDIRLGEPSKK